MIRILLVTFLCCLWGREALAQDTYSITSTENATVEALLNAFERDHAIDFSYDVTAVKQLKLKHKQGEMSIAAFKNLLKAQTSFVLRKVGDKSYILVEHSTTIPICGVVVDASTSFALSAATITTNKTVTTLTDQQGTFKLRLPPKDAISIAYLGYQTKILGANAFVASRCDTIRLQPETLHLSPVLINDYLTTGIQKNEDAGVTVSTKKLRILPGLVEPDVLQSLQLLPGISSPTEDPAGLYIRGGTPDQNLVLWDDIKIYQTGHFFNQISTFNPYIVKDVKVYRGGTNVRYGDRVSGTIIIHSDDDLTEDLQIGGGVNFTHADLFAKIPLSQHIGLMGAVRRSTTDLYQNINYNNLVQKVFQNTRAEITEDNVSSPFDAATRDDNFSFSDANFKAVWLPNATNSIKLSSIFSQNTLNNRAPIQNLGTTSSLSTEDQYNVKNLGASLNWEKHYPNKAFQKTTVYMSLFDTKYRIDRAITEEDQNLDYTYTQDNVVKDIGVSYALDIPIAKKQLLALGYQYFYNETQYFNEERITGSFEDFLDNNTTGHNNHHTLYTQYTYKGTALNTYIGLRGSYLSRQERFFIEPRLFSSLALFKNFRLTASAELKNQQINNYSDFGSLSPSIGGLPVADDVLVLSGATVRDDAVFTIPVLKSSQFTLGTLYTYNGWNFDLEGYYKRLSDITSVTNPILEFISISESQNDIELGTEQRIGLDFLLKKRLHNYRFWLGYSLSKTITRFSNLQDSAFPGNFDQRHIFNISQTLKVKGFEFALGWNYASGRPFTRLIPDANGFAGKRLDPNGVNANRIKAYHRLDASVLYRFTIPSKKPWGGMLGVSLRNIYNRNNTIGQGFREVGENDILVDTFERESLRLTPDVVLRFNF